MICCVDSDFLGCYDSCGNIDTGLIASETGNHIIYLYVGMIRLKITESVTSGNNIIITSPVNENYTFEMNIKNPSGSAYSSGGKECWTFKTDICV